MGMIRGDLTVLGISNLLQVLSTNHREGFLTLRQGDEKKVLHLAAAGLRLVSGARRIHPLGEILVRLGKLTREQLKSMLAEQRLTRRPLGEMVVRRGILAAAQLESALREQVAEEIYDLFTWPSATFTYVDVQDTKAPANEGPLATVVLNCDMMTLLLEAARRVDELTEIRAVLPEMDRVLERQEPGEPGKGPAHEVLGWIDGKRSIQQVVEASIHPKFMVLRALHELVIRGILRVRGSAEPVLAGSLGTLRDSE